MKFLDDLSVSKKLWGFTALLVGALSSIFIMTEQQLTREYSASLAEVRSYDDRIADTIEWRGLTDANIQRVIAMAVSRDPALTENFQGKVGETIKAITDVQRRVTEEATSDPEKRQLAQIAARRAAVLRIVDKGKLINQTGDSAGAKTFVATDVNPAVDAYIHSLDDFGRLQMSERDTMQRAVQAHHAHETNLLLSAVAALTLLALGFAAAVVRSICKPLGDAVAMSSAIASGDLTKTVSAQRRDELGHMLRSVGAMVVQLRSIVTNVRTGVEAVSVASAQIAMGNANLSQRTEEQAGSLQETAASMEQLNATVQLNAESAASVSKIATSTAEAANSVGQAMGDVVDTMGKIRSGAHRISEIATVIDGIAFQTNILALNAAVEAARAGAHGRGFAVVAGEVRTLAHRSAAAAKDIKALIEASVADVMSGSSLVLDTGSAIERVFQQIQSVHTLIQDISTSSSEQARGVAEIGIAISQLDTMTQQNAALVEQSTAATESMAEMSARLAAAMSAFRLPSEDDLSNV